MSLHWIVIQVRQVSSDVLLTEFRSAQKWNFEQAVSGRPQSGRTVQIGVELSGEVRGDPPVESTEGRFLFCLDGLVNMVVHQGQTKDPDSEPPGINTENREEHKTVLQAIKQRRLSFWSSANMVWDIRVKSTAPHSNLLLI